ncbi:MAG: prealbumin-like fold domain-containing protein [Clostridiales Family XIII bacterium]|nr:prealbumin-like fold domain-containing protein [Clostridiales Family XIII bacterium]
MTARQDLWGADNPAKVMVSKTIRGTEIENEFLIDLEVNTKETVKRTATATDAAVSLVLDLSGSMWCTLDGKGEFGKLGSVSGQKIRVEDTRLYAMQQAVLAFLDSYRESAENTGGAPARRMLSLVVFGTVGRTVALPEGSTNYWVDIADSGNFDLVKGIIEDLTAGMVEDRLVVQGIPYDAYDHQIPGTLKGQNLDTNIDGGLLLARNLYRTTDVTNNKKHPLTGKIQESAGPYPGAFKNYDYIENCNVLLLTDGKANRSGRPNYNRPGTDPAIFDYDYRSDPFGSAVKTAGEIKAASFTIEYPDNEYMPGMDNKSSDRWKWDNTYPKKPATLYTVAMGTGEEADKPWLENSIASNPGTALEARDAPGLAKAFREIAYEILTASKAWTVTDPMGPYSEFIEILPNGDGAPEAGAEVKDQIIRWDLTAPNALDKTETRGDESLYTYKLSYRIRLNNTAMAGDLDADVETNAPAWLSYTVTTGQTTGDALRADLPVPKVKSLKSALVFTKYDAENKALEGAHFKIAIADGAGDFTRIVASGADGRVVFADIPSGHNYALTEMQAPTGYKTDGVPYVFRVSYGDIVTDGVSGGGNVLPYLKDTPWGIHNQGAKASLKKEVRRAGSSDAWATSVTIAAGGDAEFLITITNTWDRTITEGALTLSDHFLGGTLFDAIAIPEVTTPSAIRILFKNGAYKILDASDDTLSEGAITWNKALLTNDSTVNQARFTNTARLYLEGTLENVSSADVVLSARGGDGGGGDGNGGGGGNGGTSDPGMKVEPGGGNEPGNGGETGEVEDVEPSYPFPTFPGQTVIPQDDGTYLVLDENGVPLGTWRYDPELGEWIFDAAPPLTDLPQTGFRGAFPEADRVVHSFVGLSALFLLLLLSAPIMAAGREKRRRQRS